MNLLYTHKNKIITIMIIILLVVTNIITYHYASSNTNVNQSINTSADTVFVNDSETVQLLKDSIAYFHAKNIDTKKHVIYKHDTLGNTTIIIDSSSSIIDTIKLTLTKFDSIYVHDTLYVKDSTNLIIKTKKENKFNVDVSTYATMTDDFNFSYGAKATFKYMIFNPVYVGTTIKKENLTDLKNWDASVIAGISINF